MLTTKHLVHICVCVCVCVCVFACVFVHAYVHVSTIPQGGVLLMLVALFMAVGRRAAAKKLAVDLGGERASGIHLLEKEYSIYRKEKGPRNYKLRCMYNVH